MKPVKVRLFAGAAEAFGGSETELEGVADLTALVDRLCAGRDDKLRKVLDQCSFFVDDEHWRSSDGPIPDGATVDVLPPFAGG